MPLSLPPSEAARIFHASEYEIHDPCGHIPKPEHCTKCLYWKCENALAEELYSIWQRSTKYKDSLTRMKEDLTVKRPTLARYDWLATMEQLEEELRSLDQEADELKAKWLTYFSGERSRIIKQQQEKEREWRRLKGEEPETVGILNSNGGLRQDMVVMREFTEAIRQTVREELEDVD